MHVPLGEGGAETIIFDLLCEAHRRGDTIKALGAFNYLKVASLNNTLKSIGSNLFLEQQPEEIQTLCDSITYPSFSHAVYQMPGTYTITLAREDHFHISFSEYLKQFGPDVVLLQAESCLPLYLICLKHKKRVAYYVQTPFDVEIFHQHLVEPPLLLVNSVFLKKNIENRFGYACELLYPAIESSRYRVERKSRNPEHPLKILFINPVPAKGVEIFLALALHFKDLSFRALEGWQDFDEAFTLRCKALPNVQLLPKTWDMAAMYRETDLLIVPSQWEEAFGRVVVEAHAAGVPTLASSVGGLPEASGDAGMLVEDYSNPEAWKRTLQLVIDHPTVLSADPGLLQANAQRFSPQKAYDRLNDILKKL